MWGMNWLTGHDHECPRAGGGTESFTSVIKNATNPDSTVYDTNRVGGAFQYGFTPVQGIKPNASYTILLHAADLYWSKPGQRTFTVSANGVPVLTNYDVIAEAGKTNLSCSALIYGLFLHAKRYKWLSKSMSNLLCEHGLPAACILQNKTYQEDKTESANQTSILSCAQAAHWRRRQLRSK